MTTKYDPDLEAKLPDLGVLRLRLEVAELKKQLEMAQTVLKENGLDEVGPKPIEPAELICITQIDLLKQLSDKGMPFAAEDVKNLETLVKTLLAIRGKALPIVEEKKKKPEPKQDVAKLLSIAGDKKFERD